MGSPLGFGLPTNQEGKHMATTYPETEPMFKVGDLAIAGPQHRWAARTFTEISPGAICEIIEVDPNYQDYQAFATHTYKVEVTKRGGPIESHIDEDCLTLQFKPVSDAEMVEVLRLLGVKEED